MEVDFIDDFIKEYKNNPCLWKADSENFKNRSKRQEAYQKLIEVAAKHGEHYNVERTKQKINNLRCAFRHQLKKYHELKRKGGEKEETYCPKRRYFESLMFLKDEENFDKTSNKRESNAATNLNSSNSADMASNEDNANASDVNEDKGLEVVDVLVANSVQYPKTYSAKTTTHFKTKSIVLNDKNVTISPANIEFEDHEPGLVHEVIEISGAGATSGKHMHSQVYDFDTSAKESTSHQNSIKNERKRLASTSSRLSNDIDISYVKIPRIDLSSMDFEKLFTLACKSIQTNVDDHFSSFGKVIAHKLRGMESNQAVLAEKIISDVLFQGQMKLLTPLSVNQFLNIDTEELQHE